MKMTLKERITKSKEVLSTCDFQNCMRLNDMDVVFYASTMLGSQLDRRHNDILMNRNAIPNRWQSNSHLSDGEINFSLKKAFIQVEKYIKEEYNITHGRVLKLLEILSYGLMECLKLRRLLTPNESLNQYLRKLNDLRTHCKEMTYSEIYDFSFNMVYDLIDNLSLSNGTLALAFVIMYWIQRENNLIPLALLCDKDAFITLLDTELSDNIAKNEERKKFQLLMRKSLDLHLRKFLKSKDNKKGTSRDRILELIMSNPKHTAKTMASCLGLSVQAVQKQIVILKSEGRLTRIGPDKGGHWKVSG